MKIETEFQKHEAWRKKTRLRLTPGILVFGLFLFFLSGFGQTPPTIHIQTGKSKTFNLSEIAETVTPVILETGKAAPFDVISDVLWTKGYLFVGVYSVEFGKRLPSWVLQYGHDGKFIREIGEQGGNVYRLLCDTVANRLFVPKNKEVFCYDFDGKLIDTYQLTGSPGLYDKGYFLMQYAKPEKDGMHYYLTKYDIQTAKEDILFDFTDREQAGNKAFIARPASFSYRNGAPIVAFGIDSTLYQVQGKTVTPVVKFTIDRYPVAGVDVYGYNFQGFIGNYLCIHFLRDMQHYLYLKNMNTGKIFQTKHTKSEGIKDDMLDSGYCRITPLNRRGYFYFTGEKSNPANPDETVHTIYIVKLK